MRQKRWEKTSGGWLVWFYGWGSWQGGARGLMFDPCDRVNYQSSIGPLTPPLSRIHIASGGGVWCELALWHRKWNRLCWLLCGEQRIIWVTLLSVLVNNLAPKTNGDRYMCERVGPPQVHLSAFFLFSRTPFPHKQGSQRCFMIDGGGSWLLNAQGD